MSRILMAIERIVSKIDNLIRTDTESLFDILSYTVIGILYMAIFGFFLAPVYICYRYAKRNNMARPGLWAFGGFVLGWIMLLIQVLIYHNLVKRKL